jgi:hypothetical protein
MLQYFSRLFALFARPAGGGSRSASASVGALGLSLLSAAGASPQSPAPLVRITGPSPLAGCTTDDVKSQEQLFGSILYPNTAIEPGAAIDPTDPNRILVYHQQDRWSDGGARGLVGGLSNDGGVTWTVTTPSGVTNCTGGRFVCASDPWVTFAPDGTAFAFSLTVDPAAPTTPFGASAGGMLVSRSRDHGISWEAPKTLIVDNTELVLNDKNSITADPTAPGNVYAVWDRLSIFPAAAVNTAAFNPGDLGLASPYALRDGVLIARARIAQLRAAAAARAPQPVLETRGPTYFSHTADNGATWSRAVPIYDPGVNAQTINNIVVVPPSGRVDDCFTNIDAAGNLKIGFIRSPNKGFSWSRPIFATDIQVSGVITPNRHDPVRDASILFSGTTDPTSGALYLAWQDFRFNPNTEVDDIAFSQSLDGGATWSAPTMVNKTPQNLSNKLRQQAFIPTVAVAGDGTIAVTYYDFRNDIGTPGVELTDYFAVFCNPSAADCSQRANWGHELRLTPSSFNMLDAPLAGGHFLGDYMSTVAHGKQFWPVFGAAVAPNRVAEFTRKISLP